MILVGIAACGEPDDAAHTAPILCEPGTEQACYSGPADTQGVGTCRAGSRACLPSGRGWSACEGEVTPVAEECGNEADENCDGMLTCGETVWSLRFGSDVDDAAVDVDSDADGNMLVTGSYRGPMDLGGPLLSAADQSRDVFAAKLAPDGSHLWSLGIHAGESLTARNIASAPDGRVAASFTARANMTIDGGPLLAALGPADVGLLWLDASGVPIDAKVFGDENEQSPLGLAFDADGSLVVSGFFRGTLDFGTDPLTAFDTQHDVFVAKFGADAQPKWSISFFGSDDDIPRALAVDRNDGSIYVAGEAQWDLTIGDDATLGAGDRDVFLAKLNADGEVLWSHRWGDSRDQEAYGLAVDAAGDVVIVGGFSGKLDLGTVALETPGGDSAFVAKLSPNGDVKWGRTFESGVNQRAYEVLVDSTGRLVVTGFYEGFAAIDGTALPESGVSEPSMFVTKLEPDGTALWSRGLRVIGEQSTQGVQRGWRGAALGPDDQLLLAGFVEGPLDLGLGPLEPKGGTDVLLSLLSP